MKIVLAITVMIYSSGLIIAQDKRIVLKLYEVNHRTNDTMFFCTIVKELGGYTFVFHETVVESYKQSNSPNKKIDTIREKFVSSYGPYVFTKKRNRIMYKDTTRGAKFSTLYNLDYREFLAPNLFSSSPGYNIPTSLIDPDCVIFDGIDAIKCYKYVQTIERTFDKLYMALYIEKKSLLPYRMEYYDQREFRFLLSTVFAVKSK